MLDNPQYQNPAKVQDYSVFRETIGAVGYGAERAARSTWNFLDTVTFDLLPDANWEPIFHEPDTFTGKLIAGSAQFFIPYAGLYGGLAKIGGVASKTGRAFNWLSGKGAFLKGRAAGKGQIGLAKAIFRGETEAIATGALKGSIVDFIAFDGRGDRVSNILTEAGIGGDFTAWLAADEEDSALEARMKETLEGALLGGVFDTIMAFGRGGRAYQKAKKAGASDEAALREGVRVQNESHEAAIDAKAVERDAALNETVDNPVVSYDPSTDTWETVERGGVKHQFYQYLQEEDGLYKPRPEYLESQAIQDLKARVDPSLLDEAGNPQVFYHGSSVPEFKGGAIKPTKDPDRVASAVWLASNPDVAAKNGSHLTPVFIDGENVFDFYNEGDVSALSDLIGREVKPLDPFAALDDDVAEAILDLGYDVVRTKANEGPGAAMLLLNGRSAARSAMGSKFSSTFEGDALLANQFVTGKEFDAMLEEDVKRSLTLGESLKEVESILDDVENRAGQSLAVNPRELPLESLREKGLTRGNLNLSVGASKDPQIAERMARAIEKVTGAVKKTYVPNEELFAQDLKTLTDIGVLDTDGFQQMLAGIPRDTAEGVEVLNEIASKARVMTVLWKQSAERFHPKMFELMTQPTLSPDQARYLADMARMVEIPLAAGHQLRGAFGRNMQTFARDPMEWIKRVDPEDTTVESLTPIQRLSEVTDDMTPEEYMPIVEQMKEVMQSGNITDDMVAMRRFNSMPFGKQLTKAAVEARTMGLLSNGSTLAVSAASIVGMGFWRPAERWLGAVVGSTLLSDEAARAAQKQIMRREIMTAQNFLGSFTEIMGAVRQSGGWKGLKNSFGSDSLLEGNRLSDVQMLLQRAGVDEAPARLWGQIATAPGLALQKADSALKLGFGRTRMRSSLRAALVERGEDVALMDGKIKDMLDATTRERGKAREYLAAEMAIRRDANAVGDAEGFAEVVSPDQNQYITDLNLTDSQVEAWLASIDEATRFGSDIAFTGRQGRMNSDLEAGAIRNIGSHIQRIIEDHPVAKFFVPFVRTPTNIAEYTFDRTIGGVLGVIGETMRRTFNSFGGDWQLSTDASLKIQRMLGSGDPELVNEAITGMVVGMGVVGSALGLAMQVDEDDPELPVWTGRGPSNAAERQALMQRGWQPYSVKIGGTYVSYQRLDPIGTIMGVIVDSSDYLRHQGDGTLGSDAFMAMTYAPAIAIANNIGNKTYMKGIADTLKLILEPDKYAESYVRSNAATFLPYSGLAGGINRSIDDNFREVRTFQDAMFNRLPGMSDRLPVKRNVLGEPIEREYNNLDVVNFMRMVDIKDGVVNKEMGSLGYGFSMPGTTKGHIDLLDERYDDGGSTAYDSWMSRSGKIKINGLTLRQALRKEIKSSEYQRMDAAPGPNGETSLRVGALNSVIFKYRERAWRELLKENPTLRAAARQVEVNRSRRRSGLTPLTIE